MNLSLTGTVLATALLACTGVAGATAPGTANVTAKPVVPRPTGDATTEHILTAMSRASTWGHPDLFGEFAGMRLYSEGHYKAAIKYFEYGARYADKLSQLSIGLMYDNGHGVARDPVTACAWLALAAERKYPSFVATRNRVCEALTPAQHDQAVAVLDKLLPEYGDRIAKHRMTMALNMAKMQSTGSRLGFDSGVTTVGVSPGCGGGTIAVGGIPTPIAGCGSNNFWSPWRWDPQKYFAARDAQWRGTVTVGKLAEVAAPPHKDTAGKQAGTSPAPAKASPESH